jgi:hypothetical protein
MHESFYPLSTTYQIHLNRNKSALYNITIFEEAGVRVECTMSLQFTKPDANTRRIGDRLV